MTEVDFKDIPTDESVKLHISFESGRGLYVWWSTDYLKHDKAFFPKNFNKAIYEYVEERSSKYWPD